MLSHLQNRYRSPQSTSVPGQALLVESTSFPPLSSTRKMRQQIRQLPF